MLMQHAAHDMQVNGFCARLHACVWQHSRCTDQFVHFSEAPYATIARTWTRSSPPHLINVSNLSGRGPNIRPKMGAQGSTSGRVTRHVWPQLGRWRFRAAWADGESQEDVGSPELVPQGAQAPDANKADDRVRVHAHSRRAHGAQAWAQVSVRTSSRMRCGMWPIPCRGSCIRATLYMCAYMYTRPLASKSRPTIA